MKITMAQNPSDYCIVFLKTILYMFEHFLVCV